MADVGRQVGDTSGDTCPGLCPDKQGTAGILARFRGGRMAKGGGLENLRQKQA
jgi:hypothetical protein